MSDLLFATPGNPVPPDPIAGLMAAPDRRRIRYACFPAQGRPLKGTVIILQGRNECIEKYFETIRDLSARGLGTAILDWRGQGGSDRLLKDSRKGYVRSFDQYVSDLDQFFEEVVLPDCRPPFFVLGHSTGSLVALLASPHLVNRVQRMVLSAPLLALAGTGVSMATLGRISGAMRFFGLGGMTLSGRKEPKDKDRFAANVLTSDRARYERNRRIYEEHPELGIGAPTAAWINAACRASAKARDPDFVAQIRIPTLLIAAGADTVVSTPAIEAFAAGMRLGSILTLDGARHELLQEADKYREPFLAAFNAFIPGSLEEEAA
jgi:lysophospholipase